MSSISRDERVTIIVRFLSALGEEPATLQEVAKTIGAPPNVLKWNLPVLKKHKLVMGARGRGLCRPPGAQAVSENDVRRLLNYQVVGENYPTECSDCGRVCNRYYKKTIRTKRIRAIYTDDLGRQWKEKTCPECANENQRYEPRYGDHKTTRRCQDCNGFLPQSRYYKCYRCQPELPSDEGDLTYFGE